jgi:hypothetical protein
LVERVFSRSRLLADLVASNLPSRKFALTENGNVAVGSPQRRGR